MRGREGKGKRKEKEWKRPDRQRKDKARGEEEVARWLVKGQV